MRPPSMAVASRPATTAVRPRWTLRRVRWPVRLALVFAALLVPLVALELALRLAGPILPGNYETGVWAERHLIFGHFHVPGASAWVRTPEYVTHLQFDRHGLRGPEVPVERHPGVPRVLLLGDSFLEAKEITEPLTVSGRLRASTVPALAGVEWLNSGVFDWGPVQQLLYLRHEGARFRPDLVVHFFYVGNDVADNFPRSERDRRRLESPAAEIDDDSLVLLPWAKPSLTARDLALRALGERSTLFQAFRTGVLDKVDQRPRALVLGEAHLFDVFGRRESPALKEAWQVVELLLGAIRVEAAAQGAQTLLVIVPGKWQVHQEDWLALLKNRERPNDDRWDLLQPNHRLAQLAARHDLPILDLLPALQRAATGARVYFPVDLHWTAEGHAVAARELESYLVSSDLLPPR